jgi:hypothetical protein
MLIIHHPHDKYILIAIALWLAIWVYLVIKACRISRKQIKQIEDDHYKNVNETVLLSDRLSEEEMVLFNSEFKIFDGYKSGN